MLTSYLNYLQIGLKIIDPKCEIMYNIAALKKFPVLWILRKMLIISTLFIKMFKHMYDYFRARKKTHEKQWESQNPQGKFIPNFFTIISRNFVKKELNCLSFCLLCSVSMFCFILSADYLASFNWSCITQCFRLYTTQWFRLYSIIQCFRFVHYVS